MQRPAEIVRGDRGGLVLTAGYDYGKYDTARFLCDLVVVAQHLQDGIVVTITLVLQDDGDDDAIFCVRQGHFDHDVSPAFLSLCACCNAFADFQPCPIEEGIEARG